MVNLDRGLAQTLSLVLLAAAACGDDGNGSETDPATEAAFQDAKEELDSGAEAYCACPAAHDDTEARCLETRRISDEEWDCIRERFREDGMDTEATYHCMAEVSAAEADCIANLDCTDPAEVQACTEAWENDVQACFGDIMAALETLDWCI